MGESDLLAQVDAGHAVHLDVGDDDVDVVVAQPIERVL
jgi:hypothetical protein